MFNKTIPITLMLLAMLFFSVFIYNQIEIRNNQRTPTINNFAGNVILGLEPSTPSRTPTDRDEYKLNIRTDDAEYVLFQSKSLEHFDYGKTFVVRIR